MSDSKLLIKVKGAALDVSPSLSRMDKDFCKTFVDAITYHHPTNPLYTRPLSNTSLTKFPVGFLYRLVNLCKQFKIPYEIVYDIPPEEFADEKLFGGYSAEDEIDIELKVPLYPVQEEALEALKKNRLGILGAFIRTGKTNVAGALFAYERKPAFFLVHNNDQLQQAYERFMNILDVPSVGRVGGGYCDVGFITVATRQSLMSFLGIEDEGGRFKYSQEKKLQAVKAWRDVSIIVVDEAHHAAAPGVIQLMKEAKRAYRRNGLTATPRREDGREVFLEAVLGSVVHKISYDTAVKHKLAVPATFEIISMPSSSDCESSEYMVVGKVNFKKVGTFYESGNTYGAVYERYIILNPLRNILVLQKALEHWNEGRSVGIIVGWRSHGEELARRLGQYGCEFLFANYPGKAISNGIYWSKYMSRNDFWDAVRDKKERLIVSTLMDEALDLPPLDVVILAPGGKSVTKFIQRLRNLSYFEGKDRGYVVYFMDTARWLDRHSKTTKKLIYSIVEQHKQNKCVEVSWKDVLPSLSQESSSIHEVYEKAKRELEERFPIRTPYYEGVSQTLGRRMLGL